MMISATSSERQFLRAAWQPQVIYSVLYGGVVLYVAVKGIGLHRTDLLYGAAICACWWVAGIAWFRGFALETDREALIYRAPLARTIKISIAEIRSVSFRRIEVGSRWRSVGYQAIAVELKGKSVSPVLLNARVFPQEGLDRIFGNLAVRGIPINK